MNSTKLTALDDLKEIRRILKIYKVDKQVCSIYFGYRTHSKEKVKRNMSFQTILANNTDFRTLNSAIDIDLNNILSDKLECEIILPGDPKEKNPMDNTIQVKVYHKLKTRIPSFLGGYIDKIYNYYTTNFNYTYLLDETHLYITIRGAGINLTIEDNINYLQISFCFEYEYNEDIWDNFWREIHEYFAMIRVTQEEYTEEELEDLKLWNIEYDKTFILKRK